MKHLGKAVVVLVLLGANAAYAEEKPLVGLIPKASKPIKMDGKLDDWDGAFVTPVHVGVEAPPDFVHRRFHRPLRVSADWHDRVP